MQCVILPFVAAHPEARQPPVDRGRSIRRAELDGAERAHAVERVAAIERQAGHQVAERDGLPDDRRAFAFVRERSGEVIEQPAVHG